MQLLKLDQPWFIFDVESIGLHGTAFAVAGGVYIGGAAMQEFCFSIDRNKAVGFESDRKWVNENIPLFDITHTHEFKMREDFWNLYKTAKRQYPNLLIAGECLWPVEANFFTMCVNDNAHDRSFEGPYPFHEIASIMLAAGMDPMASYDRTVAEQPKHHPLSDVRQSARLLYGAIYKLVVG